MTTLAETLAELRAGDGRVPQGLVHTEGFYDPHSWLFVPWEVMVAHNLSLQARLRSGWTLEPGRGRGGYGWITCPPAHVLLHAPAHHRLDAFTTMALSADPRVRVPLHAGWKLDASGQQFPTQEEAIVHALFTGTHTSTTTYTPAVTGGQGVKARALQEAERVAALLPDPAAWDPWAARTGRVRLRVPITGRCKEGRPHEFRTFEFPL